MSPRETHHLILPCKAATVADFEAAAAGGAAGAGGAAAGGWTKRAIGELADRLAEWSAARDATPVCLLSASLGVVDLAGRRSVVGSLLVYVEPAPMGWEPARALWLAALTLAAQGAAHEAQERRQAQDMQGAAA